MIFPSYRETHCHFYSVYQTYSVHERTNTSIVTSPCKSDLLSASQENKTDLLSAWNDQGISTISPSDGMLVQCWVTSLLPRFASASTHLYTGEERAILTARGLPREPIVIELAWGLYWGNLSQSCSFVVQVYFIADQFAISYL